LNLKALKEEKKPNKIAIKQLVEKERFALYEKARLQQIRERKDGTKARKSDI